MKSKNRGHQKHEGSEIKDKFGSIFLPSPSIHNLLTATLKIKIFSKISFLGFAQMHLGYSKYMSDCPIRL